MRNAGLKKMKEKSIDELMLKLPREERMRIEAEEKRKKAMVLREIEENVWNRWRGKVEKKGNKVIGRMAAEDLDKKIDEIQKRLEEIKREEEKTRLGKQKRYTWERRE